MHWPLYTLFALAPGRTCRVVGAPGKALETNGCIQLYNVSSYRPTGRPVFGFTLIYMFCDLYCPYSFQHQSLPTQPLSQSSSEVPREIVHIWDIGRSGAHGRSGDTRHSQPRTGILSDIQYTHRRSRLSWDYHWRTTVHSVVLAYDMCCQARGEAHTTPARARGANAVRRSQ